MEFNDLTNVVRHYEESVFPKMLDYYKLYYGDLSERKNYIKEWQSNIPAKIFARIVDTFWSRIYDNKFKFYVSPNDSSDIKKTKLVEDLLTRGIEVSHLKRKFWKTAKDALLTWEWYGRIKYTIEQDKVEYINPNKGKREFYSKDIQYPDYVYASPFNVMVDPTAASFEDARYVIHRRTMTPDQISKEYAWTGVKVDYSKLIWKGQYLYTTDWLMMKNNSFSPSSVINVDAENSKVSFDTKKYLEVVEYWEDNKLIIYVNGQQMYNDINPMPVKKIPFIQITFMDEPWSPRWIWLGFQLQHLEKVWTAAINAFEDDMKLKSTPVYKMKAGLNPLTNQNTALDIRPWDTIMVEDPNDLTVMELGRLNYDIQNLYQFLLNEAMMIAGVNDIVMWWPLQKVDRSATSVSGRMEWFKARTLTFFDSINTSLWRLAEMWLWMIVAFNKGSNFEFKVFDDEQKKTTFSKINLEDIEWQFDILFDTQALKSALRDIALQKKMNFLQVAWQLAVDPVTHTPIVNLSKLVEEIGYDLDLPELLYTKQDIEQMQKNAQQQQQPESQQATAPQQPQPQQPQQPQEPQQAPEDNPQTPDQQAASSLLQKALNPNG